MDTYPLSWSLNPPQPGDPEYADYVSAQPREMARIAALVAAAQAPSDPWAHVPDPRDDPAFEFDPVMSPPRPAHVADLVERPAGADDWGAERFYRPGSIVTIGAPPGVGKSWIRSEIAIRQVTGEGDILGTYPVRQQANVLVIDEDMGALEEWLREEALATALGSPEHS